MPGEATRREQQPDSTREGNTERDSSKNPNPQHQPQHGNNPGQGKQGEQGNRPGQTPQQGDRQNPQPSDPSHKGSGNPGSVKDVKDEDTSTQRRDDRGKQPQR
jgi:hypothetical protein